MRKSESESESERERERERERGCASFMSTFIVQDTKGVSQKTIPHQSGVMINKRVIYLKGRTYRSQS